jgi:hypothetical protein
VAIREPVERSPGFVVDFCRFRAGLYVIPVMPFIVGRHARRQTRHEEDVMAKFLYLFTGGEMAATPEAQEEQMQEWTSWFGTLGDSVVDMGNAFGGSSTVTNGTASDGGASKLGGYSIINAESLGEATKKAGGCPVLRSGGSVEVYEALPM